MGRILAILEQRDGVLKRVSHETLTAARALGESRQTVVDALAMGPPGLDVAAAGTFGAETVWVARDDRLALYQPDLYAAIAAERARSGYDVVLLGATALGKDLGPRLAARLECPLATEVTELTFDGGVVVRRPAYSGKAVYRLRVRSPCVVSLRPNNFTPAERAGPGTVKDVAVPRDAPVRVRTLSLKEPEESRLDVTEAPIVVSGGRGLQDPKNFKMLEELAAALGSAAVGASRAVVDAGWRPHADQVGQTGKTVSPSLYIAVGISGAVQHLAGMRTAKVIVAINKDKDAPIFRIADYGIVGDLFAIVPRLTEEIRKLRAG